LLILSSKGLCTFLLLFHFFINFSNCFFKIGDKFVSSSSFFFDEFCIGFLDLLILFLNFFANGFEIFLQHSLSLTLFEQIISLRFFNMKVFVQYIIMLFEIFIQIAQILIRFYKFLENFFIWEILECSLWR